MILVRKEKNNNDRQLKKSVKSLVPFGNAHSIHKRKISSVPKNRAMMIPPINYQINPQLLFKADIAGNTMTSWSWTIDPTDGAIHRIRVIFKIALSTVPYYPGVYHRCENITKKTETWSDDCQDILIVLDFIGISSTYCAEKTENKEKRETPISSN